MGTGWGAWRGKSTGKGREEGESLARDQRRGRCAWSVDSWEERGELSLERVDEATSGQALLGWLRKKAMRMKKKKVVRMKNKSTENALGAGTI